jgi:serine/threonine protein phosphatase 1
MKQDRTFIFSPPRKEDWNIQGIKLPFSSPSKLPPAGPDDTILYAVGDIHGRSDLLDVLMDSIRSDRRQSPEKSAALVFLGDYVDRGPDSKGVLDRIIAIGEEAAFSTTALRGNHEHYLLSFLQDPEGKGSAGWLEYGGRETLSSYGVKAPLPGASPEDWRDVGVALLAAMPESHLAFLSGTAFTAQYGPYVFVHAGVRPGIPLDDQDAEDLTMIRKPFLHARQPLRDCVVVFGHTVFEKPVLERWKVGLDTGAYASGILTAMKIDGRRWYFCGT